MAQDENFREYWVGLPVGIRVHRNGHVTWTIDTSEASSAMNEEYGEADEETNPEVASYTEDQVLMDMAVVDAQADAQSETQVDREMKCPVRYACGFTTTNLGDMAAHILDKGQTHGE